jgi:hypothetical protein
MMQIIHSVEEAIFRRCGFAGAFPRVIWPAVIRRVLERDIPQFGPRVPAETLERLWTMLAHGQASLLNASRLAASLMASAQTVTRYIDLLVDLLLVRRLQPFLSNAGKRLVKAPKVYVHDSGIVHALLGIRDHNMLAGHPVAGASWEGFVVESLIAAAPAGSRCGFIALLQAPKSTRSVFRTWPQFSLPCETR